MKLKRFLTIAILSLMSFQGYATHLLGGEIVWKCKPNGKYQFTLVLYRECAGISLPTTAQSLANECWSEYFLCVHQYDRCCSLVLYRNYIVCWGNVWDRAKCRNSIYRSGDITLTGTPPASGWYFTWNSCCRPGSISECCESRRSKLPVACRYVSIHSTGSYFAAFCRNNC